MKTSTMSSIGISLTVLGGVTFFLSRMLESGDPQRIKMEVAGVSLIAGGSLVIGLSVIDLTKKIK